MVNFQNLPDELLLKILSFSDIKDLISCGQVSKRIRRISHDGTLWMTANLEKKIVKAEFLEMILGKGCRNLTLCHTTIIGCLRSNIKSQLRVLTLSQSKLYEENYVLLEELLSSTSSLQHLVMEGVDLTQKMTAGICKNGQTLQILNLNRADLWPTNYNKNYLHEIIRCCQELREVDLADGLTYENLNFLAKNISTNIEKLNLNLSRSFRLRSVIDDHTKILLGRCNKLKTLSLEPDNRLNNR